ncbi:mate-domain-containing protein, partial [Blyttiomyces helicus]
ASALDTLCSQAHTGSADPHALGKHLQRALVVMLFLSFPIAILWCFAEQLLLLLGQDPEIARMSGIFARYALGGLYPYLANECLKRYLQCQGIMKANMFVIMFALPINIFLQWLLVWSPLAIGVIGSPIAVSITFTCLPVFTMLYIKISGQGADAWGGWDWEEALDMRQILIFLKLGFPGVAMTCSEWWAFEVVALAAGLLGPAVLAAQTILLNTCALTYMLPLGISVSASTRIGNSLGAYLPNLARTSSIASIVIGLAVATFNSTILIAVRNLWGWLWTQDKEVVDLVSILLPLAALFQISDAIGAVAGGVLRGCGRQDIGAYINLTGYYLLGIPISLFCAFRLNFGLFGLWLGLAVGLIFVSVIEIILIARMDWNQQAQRARVRVLDAARRASIVSVPDLENNAVPVEPVSEQAPQQPIKVYGTV